MTEDEEQREEEEVEECWLHHWWKKKREQTKMYHHSITKRKEKDEMLVALSFLVVAAVLMEAMKAVILRVEVIRCHHSEEQKWKRFEIAPAVSVASPIDDGMKEDEEITRMAETKVCLEEEPQLKSRQRGRD